MNKSLLYLQTLEKLTTRLMMMMIIDLRKAYDMVDADDDDDCDDDDQSSVLYLQNLKKDTT